METVPLGDTPRKSMKRRASDRLHDRLKRFDDLPNDAVLDDSAAAVILNMSIHTLRRNDPVPRRQISARRFGRRVGDLRQLIKASVV